MMTNLGIHENDFYSFMSETYDRCIKMGLLPERLEHDLKQLLDLSESVPWEQIPDHIEQQVARKQHLEQETQRLESVASEAKTRLDKALEVEAVTMNDLNQFSNFRTEVNKHRIPMANLSAFVMTIDGVRQLGYDPKYIVSKVSNFEQLQIVEKELKNRVNSFANRKINLERECGFLESQIDAHSLTLSKYHELDEMGFGLKVQKLLWNKVREIGVANQMNPDEAVRKFLKDVEQYDDKLGFESQLHNLKAEIQKD
ncbi:MAG: hypothetical protein WA667_20240 [Candidatus Nitrosopolaris sp.]